MAITPSILPGKFLVGYSPMGSQIDTAEQLLFILILKHCDSAPHSKSIDLGSGFFSYLCMLNWSSIIYSILYALTVYTHTVQMQLSPTGVGL